MTINADDAVAAARAYADGRGRPAWRAGSTTAMRVVVEGRDVWRVAADDVPPPGEPDWWFEYDGGQCYLIDVESGECVGVGLINGHLIFGSFE